MILTGTWEVHFICPEEDIAEKFNFLWKLCFFFNSGHWEEKFWLFVKKLFALSKLQSTCWDELFQKEYFLGNLFNFFQPLGISAKSCKTLSNAFEGVFRTAFYVSRGPLCRTIAFLTALLFHQFRTISQKFAALWQTPFGRGVTITVYLFKETFWGKVWFLRKFYFLIIFGEWPPKVSGGVVRTASYVSKESVWGKIFLRDLFFQKLFWTLSKSLVAFCPKFFSRLSSLHSACTEIFVEEKITSWLTAPRIEEMLVRDEITNELFDTVLHCC